ncbi:ankyrin repeat-containing domain protein [Biscogniauxia marginata]|nr:ankyrin repeat-containing domain protein [Biscogniauxia marginata]
MMCSETQDLRATQSESDASDATIGFSSIPVETLLHISSYLKQPERARLARTCCGSYNTLIATLYEHDARKKDQHALWFACATGRMDILRRVSSFKLYDPNHYFVRNHRVKIHRTRNLPILGKQQTPLIVAIRQGNHSIARELLRLGANPNTPDRMPTGGTRQCWYPINWAVYSTTKLSSWTKMVSMLVEANADINQAPTTPVRHPRQWEVPSDVAPIFQVLNLGPPIPSREQRRRPTTGGEFNDDFKAVLRQRLKQLKLLLDLGADTNIRHSETHQTPLFFILSQLLTWSPTFYFDIGIASTREKDEQSFIVIMAVEDILVELKRHGAEVNTMCAHEDWGAADICSAIHIACRLYEKHKNHKAIVEWLIQNGADVNATDSEGNTPLILLCRIIPIDIGIIGHLIRMGVDVNHQNRRGETALHEVWSRYRTWIPQQEGVIKKLLQWGANPSIKDNGGCTPLFKCMRNPPDNVRVLEELIKKGASPKDQDSNGRAPLHELCSEQYIMWDHRKKIIDVLLRHGADVYAKDHQGLTAIDCALLRKDEQLAGFLEETAERKPKWKGQRRTNDQARHQSQNNTRLNDEHK